MKTALVTPCFLEGTDPIGNDRLARNQRYIDYYAPLETTLGFDEIVLFDNASSPEKLAQLKAPKNVHVMRFDERLVRGPGPHDYPYCWRALYAYRDLINMGFEKFITIDSDGFVLSKRMAAYLKHADTGWVSFWSENGQFPESSIHVLCKDAFSIFHSFTGVPWSEYVGLMMEHELPFTHVDRQFRCSRFGELGSPPQDATMDFYGQAPLGVPLEFGKYL